MRRPDRSLLLRAGSLLLLLGLDYLLSTYAQRLDEAEADRDAAQAESDMLLREFGIVEPDQGDDLDDLGEPDLDVFAQVPPVRRCPCGQHAGPCRCQGEQARGMHTAHLTAQLRAEVE